MFGKFFAQTFTGSMCGAGVHVFAVWAYALANAARDGTVELNPIYLAPVLGTDAATVQSAIAYLLAPDPRSRTPDHDGRRITQSGAFSYVVVNHAKYRAIRSEEMRRESNRRSSQAYRDRQRVIAAADDADASAESAHAEDRVQRQKQRELPLSDSGPTDGGSEPSVKATVRDVAQRVFSAWVEATKRGKAAKLTAERVAKVSARLRDGYTEDDMLDAVRGIGKHCTVDKETGHRWDEMTLALRDGTHLERFRDAHRGAKRSNGTQGTMPYHREWQEPDWMRPKKEAAE